MTNVWVDETRPLLQGGRLTAWELGELGVPYQLIADSMAASLMAQGQVDAVWVRDRHRATATWRIKSAPILWRFWPIITRSRFTSLPRRPPSTAIARTGAAIPIEQRAAAEVTGVAGSFGAVQWAPTGGRRLQSGVRRHACWADKRLGAGQRGGHPGAGRRRGVLRRTTDNGRRAGAWKKRFSRARTNTAPLRQDHGYRRGG